MFVLVADDQHGPALAEAVRGLRPGWVAVGVTSTEDLDRALSQATPDVLVLDLCGLGGDALALARLPRGAGQVPARILLASGSDDLARIAAAEGLPYLAKPFAPEALVRAAEED